MFGELIGLKMVSPLLFSDNCFHDRSVHFVKDTLTDDAECGFFEICFRRLLWRQFPQDTMRYSGRSRRSRNRQTDPPNAPACGSAIAGNGHRRSAVPGRNAGVKNPD